MLRVKPRVVDIHYHLHSPGVARAIAGCVSSHARIDLAKNAVFTVDGSKTLMTTEEEILAEADEVGADTLVLSVQMVNALDPGEVPPSPEGRLCISQAVNDYLASVCRRYPERFMAFADIPRVGLGKLAIDEMDRTLNKLGLYGVRLWTSYDGKYLDAPEFQPFFEEANRQRAVVHIHPVAPFETATKDYHMYSIVRLPYETTLTMGRLAYAGVLERFPNIKFILSHSGGMIPFLWWRMDYGYLENYSSCRSQIQIPPTNYLRHLYCDTALSDADSILLACKRFGTDHVLLGTDSPYRTNALRDTLKTVQAMKVTAQAKTKIAGGNALALVRRSAS